MRKRRFAIAVLLAGSAVGTAWATSAKVTRTAGQVGITVENSSAYPLACDGTLTGKTKSGHFVDAKMEKVTIGPGGFQTVFVTTDAAADPFVDGWSDIACATPPQPPPAEVPED